MSYFSNFPYVAYEFPDGVIRNFKDISRRVAFVEAYSNLSRDMETYNIKEGDTPETLAHVFYGDVNMHWVIMTANNVLNVYKDWPKSSVQFDQFMAEKYATAKNNKGVAVVLTETQRQQYIEFVGIPATSFDSDLTLNDSEYIVLKPHHFVDENGRQYTYDMVITDSDSRYDAFGNLFTLPTVTPVSIYDYEFELNEKKRDIVIPSAEIADQLKKELREKINE
jgi:hypothetical protein